MSLKTLFSGRKSASRGVSIVEAVVAMAVIAIVSLAALSVISSSRITAGEDAVADQARYRAEAALECFKFADTEQEFNTVLGGLLEKAPDGSYTFGTKTVGLTVKVTYTGAEGDRPLFEATGTRTKDDKTLFHITYRKGGVSNGS